MKMFGVLCALCGLALPGFALDREAFTFTNYDLKVRIEPEQQRLAVRGKLILRNDSAAPQINLVLQLSSTLDWSSIRLSGKTVQFVSHEFTSDLDHTGSFSEAIVTLPREVLPKGTVELDVGYDGTIPLDASRLTQIGVPVDKARHSDWDQISKAFTSVRGIGYVAWYPVATEPASLSEGNSVEETIGRWKVRQADSTMSLSFESMSDAPIFFSGGTDSSKSKVASFKMLRLGASVPTFVIANYQKLAVKDLLSIQYLPGQEEAAKAYAEVGAQIDVVIPTKRGDGNLEVLGLPDADAASFVSEGMLLCPLKSPMTNEAELSLVYAKAWQLVPSPRAWIQEGLAHFAQAAFIEKQRGRQVALDYLNAHRAALTEAEKVAPEKARSEGEAAHSLMNAPDGLFLQTKAMNVWWMLRDIIGEQVLISGLLNYQPAEDKEPAYLQRIIEKESHRDLQWFFDDWVYHDRRLPDFRVDSVFSSPQAAGGFLVTVTIENVGNAGAEVPVTVQIEGGEIRRRLEVHAKSKTSIRIEVPGAPQQVVVNDGSVPESDLSNNTYKVPQSASSTK